MPATNDGRPKPKDQARTKPRRNVATAEVLATLEGLDNPAPYLEDLADLLGADGRALGFALAPLVHVGRVARLKGGRVALVGRVEQAGKASKPRETREPAREAIICVPLPDLADALGTTQERLTPALEEAAAAGKLRMIRSEGAALVVMPADAVARTGLKRDKNGRWFILREAQERGDRPGPSGWPDRADPRG